MSSLVDTQYNNLSYAYNWAHQLFTNSNLIISNKDLNLHIFRLDEIKQINKISDLELEINYFYQVKYLHALLSLNSLSVFYLKYHIS